MNALGPIGRLGRFAATHRRAVFITWAVIAVGLGVLAPRVETALSGAGWQANGSESVKVREQLDANFGGAGAYALQVAVHSQELTVADPAFRRTVARVERVLAADSAVGSVVAPRPGASISRDGHTVIVAGTAAKNPNEMVAAANDLKSEVAAISGSGVEANLTGAPGMWSDFNEANREAMMKSELISWPVTLAILVLAFGSLVAAGLPLMLTIVSLIASAGVLYLGTKLAPISIWAMNFALMFALALGIDYALFIVMRFRSALFGQHEKTEDAVGETMDTAGKAVLFSGLTVLISLSAVMLVPSPAFRSMAIGIMVSVLFVLAATMTLLPAVLAKLGPRIDKLALPWAHSGEHRSPRFARWGELLWRRPFIFGGLALVALLALALPILGMKTGMPSIKVVPKSDSSRVGYRADQRRLRARRAGHPAGDGAARGKRGDRGGPAPGPGDRRRGRARAGRRRAGPDPGGADQRSLDRRHLEHDRQAAGRPARGGAARRPLGRKPRPRNLAGVEDAAGDRRHPRARLPAAADRLPGAADRGDRGARQPALDRRRVRRRDADLPARPPLRPARLRIPGLPRRLGADLLLRDDLRDRDGLHGLPALLGARALGRARATRRRRWSAASPTPGG